MRYLLLSLMMFTSLQAAIAQGDLPINAATGHVEYTEVVNVDGVTADKLYNRAEYWFNNYYKNPGSVIQEANTDKNISGKHFVTIYNEVNGKKNQKGNVRYFIDVFVRDGRFKYTINDIYFYQIPKIYIEEWLDESAPNASVNLDYILQVKEELNALLADLKKTMASPIPTEAADDW